MKRKICVVTGTRAEYGLLRFVMEEVQGTPELELQVVATGMHLSPEFGLTANTIEEDGYIVDYRIESLLSSDTPVGIAKSTGLGMIGFADAFAVLKPDIVVLLGDRFEILSAAVAALYARIPVAHLHGGETTEGAFDEGIRHAITKMAHFHFVAAEEYRHRVIQLGEDPKSVYNVGGLGVDAIHRIQLLSREELSRRLEFDLTSGPFLLITFHPVTLEDDTAEKQMNAMLAALKRVPSDVRFVFTMPNADTGGRVIIRKVESFVQEHSDRAMAAISLGQLNYYSAMKYTAAVVGNSSSGLAEAPSFKVPTVNIGDRQKGRMMAESVISCDAEAESIQKALEEALDSVFCSSIQTQSSPYGEGGASQNIVKALKNVSLDASVLKKHFHDQVTQLG